MNEPPRDPPSAQMIRFVRQTAVAIGRLATSPFVPGLRDLSDEDLAAMASLRLNLIFAAFAVIYLVSGVFVTLSALLIASARDQLSGGLTATGIGAVAFIAVVTLVRQIVKEREKARAQFEELRTGGRDLQASLKEREQTEERLFQQNVARDFSLKGFDWTNIPFFADGYYRFAPRINVLLGKNGYGKTLLFRTLVALLQRNERYSGLLLPKNAAASNHPVRLVVTVTSDGDSKDIVRDATYFIDEVGGIPILAIPDSRFVNRADTTIAGAASSHDSLARSGASQFLTQGSYDGPIQDLLTYLCLEYYGIGSDARPQKRGSKGADQPIFRLIERVVRQLTDDEDFAFAEVNRIETKFEIRVRTSGSSGTTIPIQSASQGTLSVLVIFGLIYRFLQSLRPSLRNEEVQQASGIVLIDEIDAHLHPAWQQKILAILTREFPNVQFIVSAHSPVIVAGCDIGEVCVLRRSSKTGPLCIEPVQRDFLGATAEELYRMVFDIKDVDRLYLEYQAKDLARERKKLQAREKGHLSPQAEEQLRRDARLIDRAAKARDERQKREDTRARIMWLESEVKRLEHELREARLPQQAAPEDQVEPGRPKGEPGDAVP